MSVPESIAWLETSRNSKSPSAAKIYATTILGELERLNEALDTCARSLDELERLLEEERGKHRAREQAFEQLEESAIAAREEWDRVRADLENRLEEAETEAFLLRQRGVV